MRVYCKNLTICCDKCLHIAGIQNWHINSSVCIMVSQISVNNYIVSKTHVLPPGRTPWVVPSILGYSRTHGLVLSIPGYSTYRVYTSLVPRLSPSFPSLAVGEGLVHFLTWVMSQTGQIIRTWASCEPHTTSPTLTHWGMQLFWVKRWQCTKAIFVAVHKTEDREFYQVVWSFCVLVGHCAICTLDAELNITR